jgi:integrase
MVQIRPSDNAGSIRIRFKFLDKSYNLSTGGKYGDRLHMALANAVAARIEMDIASGNFDPTLAKYADGAIAPAQKRQAAKVRKLLDVWDSWVDSLELGEDTKLGHYAACRKIIVRAGNPRIDDAGWYARDNSHLSPSTYNHHLGYYIRCCKWAIGEGLTTKNPFDYVRKKKHIRKAPVKPFSLAEIKLIVDGFMESQPHYAPFAKFLLMTGCRPSEAVGIQWCRIDFDRGEVTIADNLSRNPKGKLRRKETKTGTITVLSMNGALRALLESLPCGGSDDRIFTAPRGGVIHLCVFWGLWAGVLKAQGIAHRKPYNTRHSMASHAIDQGRSLVEVAYLLGHTDTTMVSKVYGHLINRPNLPDLDLGE